ncbi:FG-GAP-like repeat-containing protein [uncultured Methylobacterium sp.]|uniref:FG-GAP-like repeat-containing protein n=1 Tax=uncultured Methylobacterium sp. TaxID=157278 RepID=UPI002624A4B4|nr:FG-GAP-like repeat-containing protein [uncultured Methylobacterium sp.]
MTIRFFEAGPVTTGSQPTSVTTADVNGDGKLDLLTANRGSNTVSVRLGVGDGTFTSADDVPTGDWPLSVTTADVNGDGRQDILVANEGSDTVSVRLGRGDGTFTTAAEVRTGSLPRSVTSADVNGDGKLDLLTANRGSNTVSVRLGVGDGTFTSADDVPTGDWPLSVTTADVNGDGKLDLLVANNASGTVSVRLGVGDGTFTSADDVPTGDWPLSVTTADVNGDGRQDILVANYLSGTVSVHLNTSRPTASLDLASIASASGAVTGLAVDATAPTVTGLASAAPDGAYRAGTDIAVQVGFSEAVTVTGTPRLTLETGAVDRAVDYVSGSGTASLVFRYTVQPGDTAADLDALTLALAGGTIRDAAGNDAALVLPAAGAAGSLAANRALVVDTTAPTVTRLTSSTRDGTYRAGSVVAIQVGFSEAVTVTGTPRLTLETGTTDREAIYVRGSGTDTLTFLYTVQPGDSAADLDALTLGLAGGTIRDAASNDAALALPAAGSPGSLATAKALVIDTAPPPTFTTAATAIGASAAPGTVLGLGGQVVLTLSTATPVVVDTRGGTPFLTLSNGGQALYTGTDGSGRSQFTYTAAAGQTTSGLTVTGLTLNGGTVTDPGETRFVSTTDVPTDNAPNSVTTADVNGDGRQDLLVANQGRNTVSVRLGVGDGTFTRADDVPTGSNPFSVTTADVNGDGRQDLLVANYLSNTVSVRLGVGDGTFTGVTDVPTGSNPLAVTTADVNGDGRQDLLVANYASGTVSVRLGRGDGTFTSATDVPTGNRPLSVTTADVNGDGRQDLLVANNSSGTVSVRLGVGDGTFTSADDVPTGNGPRSVTTADVNGDGRQDLLVANADSDTVSVRLGRGDGTFTITSADDVPNGSQPYSVTTADVNGDGRQDILVANYSSAEVSVHLNTSRPTATLDVARIASASGAVTGLAVDATAPTVTVLTATTPDGAYGAGSVIDIAVGFSEAVTVTGTPRLTLETGATDRAVDYVSGSGTASLVFRYTVQPSDTAADLDALTLALNGGAIRDAAGNDAALALPAAGGPGSLAAAKALVIDTTAPAAPVLTTPAAGSATNDATPTIAGTAEAGSLVTILVDATAIGTVTADGAGRFGLAVPAALAEGARLVTARATDAAGNVSPDTALSFTVDRTAPSLTIGPIAGDDRLNAAEHGTALVVAGTTTAEDGRVVTLGLAGRSYAATVRGGAWSVTVPVADVAALPDTAGTPLVLTADVSDQVGNPAVPATRSLAVDTIAPSVPGLALAADTGASAVDRITRNPTLVATGDPDAVLTYALDGGGFIATAPDLAVDGSRDGAHTVRMRATDAAGNVAESSLGFTLDTRAPAAPGLALAADTGASAVDRLTNDARLAVAAEPGASLRYSLDGAPETAAYDPAALADGVHTVAVTQTDAAGNVSAAASLGFTLDRTAPAVVAITPDTAGPTNAGTLTQTVTVSEAVTGLDAADFALVLTGTAAARIAGVSGSGATYTVTLADVTGDGTLRLDLAAGGTGIRDLAGNAVAGGFAGGVAILDHGVPGLTIDPVAGDGWISAAEHGSALVVAGTTTAEDGRTVTLGLAGRSYTGTVAGGAWSVTVPAGDVSALPNTAGTPLVLTADVSDRAGNPAVPATRSLAVDTTADAGGDAALTFDATADTVVNAAEARAVAFTLAGLDPDATAVATVSDGAASRSVTLAANAPGRLDLSGLDGTVTSTLTITDRLGNTVTRAGGALVLDTVAPAAPGLALANDTGPDAGDRVTADPRLTVTPAEAGGTLRTTVDGAAVATYDPAALGPGAHRVEVVQVDAAGNASAPAALDFALVDYFETITGEGPGDLTLTGSDFADLIRGNVGDDTVRGGRGADYLHGLAGNDSVDGGPGNDTVFGDLGDDRVDGGAGDDQLRGWFGRDTLTGDDGNDGVFGEEDDDLLTGGSGDDYLSGGAGDDALSGEDGDDLLFGNAGNDELVGGAGRDRFAFGRGDGQDVIRDFVTGGAEADVIAFNNGAFADFAGVQAALRQAGADAVLAYGDGDTVTIRNVQASSLTAANFTFA